MSKTAATIGPTIRPRLVLSSSLDSVFPPSPDYPPLAGSEVYATQVGSCMMKPSEVMYDYEYDP